MIKYIYTKRTNRLQIDWWRLVRVMLYTVVGLVIRDIGTAQSKNETLETLKRALLSDWTAPTSRIIVIPIYTPLSRWLSYFLHKTSLC